MRNRGPQPNDPSLFADRYLPALRAATDDLCWLLSRDYGTDSALQLVGNRYRLNKRQRMAVGRASASQAAIASRQERRVDLTQIAGRTVAIDGFNLLILLESAFGGGLILESRDGTYRDLAGVHGTYKHVRHTEPALLRVGEALRVAARVIWYFDQPVSNSGRLKTMLREMAETHAFNWQVELVYNPDKELIAMPAENVIVSSDSWILDDGGAWCNLGQELLQNDEIWRITI
ncbi:DUF434 domain-containing protein [Neolewinella aurantiaca]|uniref:DUF434 domain-containing protein n=1 Tax=Neolewinella aurantiaca TaxID=2602767 RepID=A0A5C7FJC5_9BACT|nr:DUF434 domain-containing protein [Neolewinella aurantiaca]TXF90746.1 DUF434 domain-containing protein [Neolewinella aurantiaca]